MKLRSRIILRLERQKINIQVVGQSESLTEDAVLAVNLDTRKVVGAGTEALTWRGMANFQLVWPFDHPRLIVWDWEAASFLFRMLLKRSMANRLPLKPEVLLQIVTPLEGGSGSIERRALLQALDAAGAGYAAIYEGEKDISPEMVEELLRSSLTKAPTPSAVYIP